MADENEKIPGTFSVGSKIYGVCGDCGNIIRVNKPLLGQLHFCTTEVERQKHGERIKGRIVRNLAALAGRIR